MKLLLPLLLLTIVFFQSNEVKAQFVLNVIVNDVSGPGVCDGSASIDSNNINFVTVAWYLNGTLFQNGGTTINNLCPGNYSVTASGGGMVMTSPFTVGVTTPNPCAGYSVMIQYGLLSGPNTCDGWVAGIVSGGTLPQTYQWSNGNTNTILSNLCSGTYALTVVDANGCTASATQDIYFDTTTTNPCSGFSASITVTDCSAPGACDGAAVVTSTSSPNSYYVSWSQGSNTYGITNLCEGYYSAVVTDFNGCSVTLTEFVGYNGSGTIDTINVIGNLATGGMITGTLMSNWIYNCGIDMSMLDTAYLVTATFGNNPSNQDSLYTTWYLADTTGAFTYVNCTFYAPFAVGTYNLVLQVYCPIKSTPIYYNIISQFDVLTAGINTNHSNGLTLAPNPVQNELKVNGAEKGDYNIYNQAGKCLLSGNYYQGIDVRHLANGTYFIQINNVVLPFIKNAQ